MDLSADSRLTVPDDVRLRLGDWGGDGYAIVDRLSERRSWRLNRHLAAVLVLFVGGRELGDGVRAAADLLHVSEDRAREAIRILVDRSLVEAQTSPAVSFPADRGAWAANGWTAAYDYALATWDYPFVDYDVDGWTEDRERMAAYGAEEPDESVWTHNRCDVLDTGLALRAASEVLDDLTTPLHGGTRQRADLNATTLADLMSATFGRLPPHRGVRKPRRSSPSGGARHPTEGYVINLSVEGLDTGVWHVRSRAPDLVRLADLPSDDWLRTRMSGLFLPSWQPRALVVITSVFGRNMYRYREPRTFRTIFLDAGHVIGTLEHVAQSLGIAVFPHHAVDDSAVEGLLGLKALREGVIAGVSLGAK